jgi:hypothetical protein
VQAPVQTQSYRTSTRPKIEMTSNGPNPSGATFASTSRLSTFHHCVRSQSSEKSKSRTIDRIWAS